MKLWSSLQWILKSIPAGNSALKKSRQEFLNSSVTIDDFLDAPYWYTRNFAIKLIGKHQLAEFFPRLLAILKDQSDVPIIRRNCIASALAFPERFPATEEILFHCLKDSYWEVRSHALRALAKHSEPGRNRTNDLLAPFINRAQQTSSEDSHSKTRLKEKNLDVLQALAFALGKIGEGDAAFQILAHLADCRHWQVRRQAAIAVAAFAYRNPQNISHARALIANMDGRAAGFLPHYPLQTAVDSLKEHCFFRCLLPERCESL